MLQMFWNSATHPSFDTVSAEEWEFPQVLLFLKIGPHTPRHFGTCFFRGIANSKTFKMMFEASQLEDHVKEEEKINCKCFASVSILGSARIRGMRRHRLAGSGMAWLF